MAKEQEVASAERLAAEGGIASDESAGAGAEVEANEGPVEEPEKGHAESAVAEGGSGEAGCPIEMGYKGPRCGRKLHVAPDGVDEKPVCLMHSRDSYKLSWPVSDDFWEEFERTLEAAGENEAHFERFIFPLLNFSERRFQAICCFNNATFTNDTDFSNATFLLNVDFSGATFSQKANFTETTFTQGADFESVIFAQDAIFCSAIFTKDAFFHKTTFTQDANFNIVNFKQDAGFIRATFMQDAHYSSAIFTQDADFNDAIFTQGADFSGTTFTHSAHFNNATFTQDTNFSRASFTQNTHFNHATFSQNVNFWGVTFKQNATFYKVIFTLKADFHYTTFTQAARFAHAEFQGTVDCRWCQFLDSAEFRSTKFEPQVKGEPSALFALAKFSKPGEVVFDDVDLSRALFHNCDVSQVWFTSSVRWGTRKNNRGLAVFEETISLDREDAKGLQRVGRRDYPAVAQIYQQLKKNYDSRLDYWTANEFHFGEMEMKRLAGPTDGRLLWLRQWWHRNLSFVAWYKYASDYGNSYGKPLLWLLGILLMAALLFPIAGLELKQAISASSARVTYSSVWDRQNIWTNNLWTEAKLIGKSGITAIDTATFQRTPEYTPVYPRGRVVAIVETLLTSSLFALFLLAIRRQFRR